MVTVILTDDLEYFQPGEDVIPADEYFQLGEDVIPADD